MRSTSKVLFGAAAAGALASAAIAIAAPPPGRSDNTSAVKQQLVSRSLDGGVPNRPATEPTISWDGRVARYVAYTSAATNIRPGTNGNRNVFLVTRSGGSAGGSWSYGSTVLASRGLGGAVANGDSFSPSLGGWSQGNAARKPKCLAFVSHASNIVGADNNGRADVFVRRLPGGSTRRIASPAGKSATAVAVSGDCRTIAIAAGGLYLKKGSGRLKKVASGSISSPTASYNGAVAFAKGSSIYVRGPNGGTRKVGKGSNPAAEGGKPASPNRGRIRSVAYERGGTIYYKDVGGKNRKVGRGTGAYPTGGGGQVIFGFDEFVYLYAKSNNFGKAVPQGFCPGGQSSVTATQPSSRGNYVVFSCSGSGVFLSYLGGA